MMKTYLVHVEPEQWEAVRVALNQSLNGLREQIAAQDPADGRDGDIEASEAMLAALVDRITEAREVSDDELARLAEPLLPLPSARDDDKAQSPMELANAARRSLEALCQGLEDVEADRAIAVARVSELTEVVRPWIPDEAPTTDA